MILRAERSRAVQLDMVLWMRRNLPNHQKMAPEKFSQHIFTFHNMILVHKNSLEVQRVIFKRIEVNF